MGGPLHLQLAVDWVWYGRGVECHMGHMGCKAAGRLGVRPGLEGGPQP